MNIKKEPLHQGEYILSTLVGDQEIAPFDTFEIDENEYSLLKIIKSSDNIIFLKLIVVQGPNFGTRYIIPKQEFENQTLDQLKASLDNYQH